MRRHVLWENRAAVLATWWWRPRRGGERTAARVSVSEWHPARTEEQRAEDHMLSERAGDRDRTVDDAEYSLLIGLGGHGGDHAALPTSEYRKLTSATDGG